MEVEAENCNYSIRIPLSDSDECIEFYIDELSDDPSQLIEILLGECVHPKYWIQVAAGYYSLKKYSQFMEIVNAVFKEEIFQRFSNEYVCKLVLLNYRMAYKMKINSVSQDEFKKYDLESSNLLSHEDQDKTACATCLAIKCIYNLRTDDMKAARTYMNHAIDRDENCLLATIAAALYFIQTRDYKKALKAYQMTINNHPDCPVSVRVGIAYCFYQLGNYKKAFMAVNRALQLDPYNEEALAMKASLQRSSPLISPQERIISSLQTIQTLYSVNPHHPQALLSIADHHFWKWVQIPNLKVSITKGSNTLQFEGEGSNQLHPALTLRIQNTICRIKSTTDAMMTTSCVLSSPFTGDSVNQVDVEIRDTATCSQLAKEALKEAKMSTLKSEAYELLGRCYHALNNWHHAKDMYTKAIHANKHNIIAQYEYTQVLIQLSSLARTKKEKEDYRVEARAHSSACAQFGGTSYEITFLAAYLQYKSNELPKALATIASLPDKSGQIAIPTLLNSQLLKAQLLQGNFQVPADISRARVYYENYVALSVTSGVSFSPLVWNNISILRSMCGDVNGAKTAMNEVLRLSLNQDITTIQDEELLKYCNTNSVITLLFNYAVFLDRYEASKGSDRIYRIILQSVPEYYDAVLCQVKNLLKQEKLTEAEDRLKHLCTDLNAQLTAGFLKESATLLTYVINSYTDALCMLVSLLSSQHRYDEAISMITHSFLTKAHKTDLYLNLQQISIYLYASQIDDTKGYFKIATDMIKKSIRKNPRNVYLANACGIVLQKTNKSQAALHMFKKVRENVLYLKSSSMNVANMLLRENKFDDAACIYEGLLKKDQDENLVMLYIFALVKAHRYQQAIDVLEKWIKEHSNDKAIYNLTMTHIAYAEYILNNIQYIHTGVIDKTTQLYTCCQQNASSQGCQVRSLRKPGDLNQVDTSLQYALNTLMTLQQSSSFDKSMIDAQLVRCKNLWSERDQQKQIDQHQFDIIEQSQSQVDKQKLLERRRQEELEIEQEKRQRQQRIEQMAAEEKVKLQRSLEILATYESARAEKPVKVKTHRTTTRNKTSNRAKKYDDDIIESSDSDSTDDNGEMSEEEDMETAHDVFGDVFGDGNSDDDEEKQEEKKTKKRVRAVESSSEEEEEEENKETEKRAKLDETIEKEVNDVFSDDD